MRRPIVKVVPFRLLVQHTYQKACKIQVRTPLPHDGREIHRMIVAKARAHSTVDAEPCSIASFAKVLGHRRYKANREIPIRLAKVVNPSTVSI